LPEDSGRRLHAAALRRAADRADLDLGARHADRRHVKERKDSLPLLDLLKMLDKSKPVRVPGTAVFLTADPDTAPGALLHNLKHNKVLHKRNIMLTIRTAEVPRVPESEQLQIEELTDDVKRIVATLGYMETPRVPHILAVARRRGLNFDIMQTSFFLGRRSIKPSANSGMPLWQDNLFIFLSRTAAAATDFFHIPSGRVVEMGSAGHQSEFRRDRCARSCCSGKSSRQTIGAGRPAGLQERSRPGAKLRRPVTALSGVWRLAGNATGRAGATRSGPPWAASPRCFYFILEKWAMVRSHASLAARPPCSAPRRCRC
jgi:hypothetical protein